MTIFCISCPQELPEEHATAVKHFTERNVPARFINGIHAQTFGILAWKPHVSHFPKGGELIRMAQVGLALSHYMTWQICHFYDDNTFLILEADAEFPDNWLERMAESMREVPSDWDILLLGSSNTNDKPKTQVNGSIYEVKYPFCLHAYMVSRKALPVLIDTVRDASQHIDIAIIEKAYPKLKVFTVLPRIVEQRGRELMP